MLYEWGLFYIPAIALALILLKKIPHSFGSIFLMLATVSVFNLNFNPVPPHRKLGTLYAEKNGPKPGTMRKIDMMSTSALRIHSARALMVVAVMLVFALAFRRKLEWIMGLVCITNSLGVIFSWMMGKVPNGILGNTSMDATLIAITMPWALKSIPKYFNKRFHVECALFLMGMTAILLTKSSVGLASAGILFLFHFKWGQSIRFMRGRKIWIASVILAIIAACASFAYLGSDLLDGQGRFYTWARSMSWWVDNANMVTGTGFGTFWAFGPYIQYLQNDMRYGLFTFMHNDWLQILFEQGIIGLFFFALLLAQMIKRAWGDRYLLSSVIVFGFTMILNQPLRYPLTLFAGMALYLICADKAKESQWP